MKPALLTIGQLAEQTDCKPETIRYYEQISLLPPPIRTTGNQRRYEQIHQQRLAFIRHARAMGFSVDDIRELLQMVTQPTQSCADVDAIANRHLVTVKAHIKKLKTLEKELARMIDSCKQSVVGTCRIVEVLSNHKHCGAAHS